MQAAKLLKSWRPVTKHLYKSFNLRIPFYGYITISITPHIVRNVLIAGFIWKYGYLDIAYFIHIFREFIKSYFRKSLPKTGISEIERTVCLTDINHGIHMNNLSYFKYAETAQNDLIVRCFKNDTEFKKKYSTALVATTSRFRKQLLFNQSYVLKSKIIYWTKVDIYMEHNFINKQNGFLHATMYTKYKLLHRKTGKSVKIETLKEDRDGLYMLDWYSMTDEQYGNKYICRNQHDISQSLKSWIDYIQYNSNEKAQYSTSAAQ